ncbi:MAG: CooT family nickel-binding protein [Clostridiales bacterium]|jgi:predicted RNA-binding protein|nr:CooT family nickel-binding protein [Clostridiales bacterium]
MCLSSAYTTKNGIDTLICDRVTNVSVDGGKVVLTNLLGMDTVVNGALKSIDLNKNVITIEEK